MRLFCKLCCEHKPDVIGGGKGGDAWWTRGCRCLKLHSVKDHEASSAHKMSVQKQCDQQQVEEAGGLGGMVIRRNAALQDQCDIALLAIFKAMYWLVKEDIAVVKWHSLKQLLTVVGVDLSPLYRGRNAKYDSDPIASQVLECLANVVIEQTNKMIEEAAFIGVMADETTDVSNMTQLGIHLRCHIGEWL